MADANPRFGALPLTVNFSGVASSDPDGDALSYLWDFGDGSAQESGPTVTHIYHTAGEFQVTLTVSDPAGEENTDELRIDAGHTPPRVTLQSPAAKATFAVGQSVPLRAKAVDDQGQPLPPEAFTWTVLLHHDTHTHPYLGPISGNDIDIQYPAPEEVQAAETSYLELTLVVTDTRGLQRTRIRKILPKFVKVSFATKPSGLKLSIDTISTKMPESYRSWRGYGITVSAANQRDASGRRWVFKSWSDGGEQTHTIITPPKARTYTATFRR